MKLKLLNMRAFYRYPAINSDYLYNLVLLQGLYVVVVIMIIIIIIKIVVNTCVMFPMFQTLS